MTSSTYLNSRSSIFELLIMNMNKVLHIIISHKWNDQLMQLCTALNKENNFVVIHFDKKFNVPDNAVQLLQLQGINIAKNRVKVFHGNFSIVEAIIFSFLEFARNIEEHDYVNVISSEDFPVKSNQQFFEFLLKNNDYDFLNHFPLPVQEDYIYHSGSTNDHFLKYAKWPFDKLPEYYFDRIDQSGFKKINGINKLQLTSIVDCHLHEFLRKFRTYNQLRFTYLKQRKIPTFIEYGGSGWFTIRKITLNKIISYYSRNLSSSQKSFLHKLKFSDEFFFQSIAINVTKESLINSDLRYINWNHKVPPGRPGYIREIDLDPLKRSNAFFCRKVDSMSIALLKKYEFQLS